MMGAAEPRLEIDNAVPSDETGRHSRLLSSSNSPRWLWVVSALIAVVIGAQVFVQRGARHAAICTAFHGLSSCAEPTTSTPRWCEFSRTSLTSRQDHPSNRSRSRSEASRL